MMKNKALLIFAGIVVAGLVAMFILTQAKPVKISTPYYTDNVEDWVSDVVNYETSDTTVIDVEKMTKGNSIVDEHHQRYVVNGDITSFFYSGFYNGKMFRTLYRDEEFYNLSLGKSQKEITELDKKYTKMKISAEMVPDDGIVEGIVTARHENGKFVFYIFVDEDWKQQLKFTNIIWGDKLDDLSTLNEKPFSFDNTQKGIYVEKITGDIGWYAQSPSTGGIVVGEMTKQDVVENNINNTFIMVR